MADVPQTLALITLAQNYAGDIQRQTNRKAVALRTLRMVKGEGKNVALVAESDGAFAENYADGADASDFGSDAQAPAVLSWGLYRSNFRVTGLAQAAARTSMTPAGNVQLWARNMVNATGKLASTLNAATFTGTGSNAMIGLNEAIGSTTNTYASINRSTAGNEYWRPYVADPGVATALTLAQIRTDLAGIYNQCGETPDLAFCGPALFNKVVGLFEATRRQVDIVNTPRGPIRLDSGYQTVEVDGTLFVKDKDAVGSGTGDWIYYVNSDAVEYEYLPAVVPAQAQPLMQMMADDGFGALPLGVNFEMLAKNGDSDRAMAKLYLQLCVRRPNACGVRKNVQIT